MLHKYVMRHTCLRYSCEKIHMSRRNTKKQTSLRYSCEKKHMSRSNLDELKEKIDTLLATGLRLLCPWLFDILTSLAVYLHLPLCCCHSRSEKMSGCLSLVNQDQATMIYNGSGNTLSGWQTGHVLKVWSWRLSSSCSSKYVLNKKSWTEWNGKAEM